MRITDYFTEEDVLEDIPGNTKEEILANLVDILVAKGKLPSREPYLTALIKREALGTTAVGEGIAIPHARVKNLDSLLIIAVRFKKGVGFGSLDNAPVYLLFLVLAPEESTEVHLRALARVVSLLKEKEIKEKLLNAQGPQEIYQILREEDEKEE
ncbi:MAG: PTS sugar transporter subunit IIA [Aquificota bacterium]|nr:MAG: PTS sugar transporter subunit IIA [Aquificota bacterium]